MVNLIINSDIIENIKLVIFDKDGTLMELYHYWSQMVGMRAKLICEKLGINEEHENNLLYEMGVDWKAGKLRSEGPVGIKKREIVLQAALDYLKTIGYEDTYNICYEVFREVDQISLLNLNRFIKPIEGSSRLIDLLFNNGCKIAIATTDRGERAKLACDFLGFANKIDFIIGADKVSKSKPEPEMINMIVDTLKIDKFNTVMIGDAVTDVQMGINANLKASIGVLTGLSTLTELRKLTPYIVDSVEQVKCIKTK